MPAVLFAALALAGSAHAAVVNEAEPNDSKATATAAPLMINDMIVGNSTGSSTTVAGTTSADYFLVSTTVQAPAIYRNRLAITTTGTAGHTGTIRGLGQTPTNTINFSGPGLPNATALDNTFQSSSTATTPARFNQFYTFGRPGQLYYRVTGVAATTADYTSTLTQDVITPVNLGTFPVGSITLTNTGLSSTIDTEVFVYDSTLTPVAGATNDDFLDGTTVPTGGNSLNSLLTRTYAPGTYFLAISDFNTADNQLSPADEGTANGTFLDFAGVLANSSTTARPSIPFRLTSAAGNFDFAAVKPGAFDVYWATFTVAVPEPTTLAALGLGGLLLRRRRA